MSANGQTFEVTTAGHVENGNLTLQASLEGVTLTLFVPANTPDVYVDTVMQSAPGAFDQTVQELVRQSKEKQQ